MVELQKLKLKVENLCVCVCVWRSGKEKGGKRGSDKKGKGEDWKKENKHLSWGGLGLRK